MKNTSKFTGLVLLLILGGLPVAFLLNDPLGFIFIMYVVVAAPIFLISGWLFLSSHNGQTSSGATNANVATKIAKWVAAIGTIILVFFFLGLWVLFYRNF